MNHLQVGSMDPWCGQWASVVRSQGHRLEIIEVPAWGQHHGREMCRWGCAALSAQSLQLQATGPACQLGSMLLGVTVLQAPRHCMPLTLVHEAPQARCDVQDLKTMVKDLLLSFYLKQPVTPKRLIFFRDGVSEGELATVQRLEIPQVCAG